MSDPLVDLGITKFFHYAESYTRNWYLWGYYDEHGKLTAIRYGVSSDLLCAHPDFHRHECSTPLHQHLWKVAEERLRRGLLFDKEDDGSEVTEPFPSKVVPLHGDT